MATLTLDNEKRIPLLKSRSSPNDTIRDSLPVKQTQTHPNSTATEGKENASIYFIGTATTVSEWEGMRILTDPNFLHAGDHVHLGPGVMGERKTNPAVDIGELPPIDALLLSNYHADHFDQTVEGSLNRAFPIISTPHAKENLSSTSSKEEPFQAVHALDHWEELGLKFEEGGKAKDASIKVTAMPRKHVPPGPLSVANDLLQAVPPTNGWMLDLKYGDKLGYRIYVSGDTLLIDELKEIPKRFREEGIDLMLIHLGGTTIPSPSVPLLMVTMDAKQGVEVMRLFGSSLDLTIPIHFDDYDVFLSPLDDFKEAVEEAGMQKKVVYLDRGDAFRFEVRK